MKEPCDPDVITPIVSEKMGNPTALEVPPSGLESIAVKGGLNFWLERVNLMKIGLFVVSLYLFILAISLMKDGARGITPLVQSVFSVNNAANSLGFGWLFAYTIMSGSPVAAAALTFFDAGLLSKLSAFAMITGSRLGASFIVLFIGFLYVLRGRDKASSLGMGLLSLTVTGTTYLPALLLGAFLLKTGALDVYQLHSGALLHSIIDSIIDPIVVIITNWLPEWLVFIAGLGIILMSFNFFDRCLPQMSIKESHVGQISRLVYRPSVMFILGALVTLISMSVSLSLSILVPLSSRGFVRRENVIPYIMGANITTFVDTLLAAVLLNNPPAFTIVLVEMLSVALISIFILVSFYRLYQKKSLDFVEWTADSNLNLTIFVIAIFLIPLILMIF